MTRLCAFLRNRSGATAAEFALVLPIALLFFFGILDVGRYVWSMNELEKAVQMGTRYAVATNVVAEGLRGNDYVGTACGSATLKPGDAICKEALGTISCTSTGCTCAQTPCPTDLTADAVPFGKIADRMRVVAPFLANENLTVSYSGSGLGYAGDPTTEDDGVAIAPIVTISVQSLRLRLMMLLGGEVTLPSFSYSQTLEDGDGTVAY
jgi:hypothetical protein